MKPFKPAEELVTSNWILTHYDPTLPIHLVAAASLFGLGAALSHGKTTGDVDPLAFTLRSL